MKYLTVDFGSTFTKLTAIDSVSGGVVATANAFTTIETDVMHGFEKAMQGLESKIGKFEYETLLCCSSAAGGLKMVALGLVPELTSKAAKMAASSAGAKVVKTYAFEISKAEQDEIFQINPDLVLLCGGTDGGNKDVIIANAKRLCEIELNFAVIIAGNKSASYELEDIFRNSGKDYTITENVMPTFGQLNIVPAKQSIKELFIKNIIDAKGLSKVQSMTQYKIIPTPLAVMTGCELLSQGTKKTAGIGDIVAVDLGGATTDIYSIAKGEPSMDNVLEKGIPEPFSKRTVEGDLGMRYSLGAMFDELDAEVMAKEIGVEEAEIRTWVEKCIEKPDTIAQCGSAQEKIEAVLARSAVEIAVERHCGIMESAYTPIGEIFTLTGKDLTKVPYVIGIGGAIINSDNPEEILKGAKFNVKKYQYMKPRDPQYMVDSKYIFASMGLLSAVDAELALDILKKEIKTITK